MAKPFQPAPNIAQFEMVYGVQGEVVENVYHVHKATGWDHVGLANTIARFQSWEGASAAPQRGTLCSLFKIIATDLTAQDSARVEEAVSPVIPGTGAGAMLPNNCTISIKADTGLRGRVNRGRSFWVGLVEAQVSQNYVIGASATLITNAMNTLLTDINGAAGEELVVLSRYKAGAPPTPAIGTPIINYVMVDLAVDSQRRRLPFHNRHN